uniref:AP2/ERF transcription factor n=1 Tax=Camptotheca acuminata TaxID=16922 RepID=A0A7G8AUF7_CAMAC|nr:AP2/ERF transcription factor [Camptotheca acuminata]
MSSSDEAAGGSTSTSTSTSKYKGVRCRKWGKWVSEIRVPGTRERLWLGSYSTPEAAAIAHDIAFYCLRRPSSLDKLNFPLMLPATVRIDMSPSSVQKAASDAGMAIDAQLAVKQSARDYNYDVQPNESGATGGLEREIWQQSVTDNYGTWQGNEFIDDEALNISIEDYL